MNVGQFGLIEELVRPGLIYDLNFSGTVNDFQSLISASLIEFLLFESDPSTIFYILLVPSVRG